MNNETLQHQLQLSETTLWVKNMHFYDVLTVMYDSIFSIPLNAFLI